jgi:uncharacterized cofD-like protein
MSQKSRPKWEELWLNLGGGHGAYTTLMGIKKIHKPNKIATAASTFDSGGSTGEIREQRKAIAYGDLGMHFKALIDVDKIPRMWRRIFLHRFKKNGPPLNRKLINDVLRRAIEQIQEGKSEDAVASLNGGIDHVASAGSFLDGHSMSNIIMTALDEMDAGNVEDAIAELRDGLGIRSYIYPISVDPSNLRALTSKGEISDEHNIDTRSPDDPEVILGMQLQPPAQIYIKVAEAIENADKIILSPGDFWTSIYPITCVNGFREAIAARKKSCKIIMVMNLMDKAAETRGYTTADFAEKMCEALGVDALDHALINSARIKEESLKKYAVEKAHPIRFVSSPHIKHPYPANFVEYDGDRVRHNSRALAQAIHLI